MKSEEASQIPRTFLTRAYLLEVEPGLFGLYRNIEIQDGTGAREKLKAIGPIRLLRLLAPGEDQKLVTMVTVHPKTGAPLDLVDAG